MKLQEALLRRKELNDRVKTLSDLKQGDIYAAVLTRQSVTDGLDEIVGRVPLLSADQVNHEYNFYAGQLRKIDAVIQQANWTTDVGNDDLVKDYECPPELLERRNTAINSVPASAPNSGMVGRGRR